MYRLLGWVMVLGTVTVLASPAGAQGSDTLSLQPIPALRIASPTQDSMPASHRSAQDDVDRPVEITYCPEPKYPIALAEYGFAGFVQLQYVVDTLGRPEVGDMRVLEALQPGVRAVGPSGSCQVPLHPGGEGRAAGAAAGHATGRV